jgi:hypothetical protein
MAAPSIASALRRSLLIKIISKPAAEQGGRRLGDRAHGLEGRRGPAGPVDDPVHGRGQRHRLQADLLLAVPLGDDPKKEKKFKEMETKLLQLKIPVGTGVVGKVIQTGEPVFFKNTESQAPMMTSMAKTTGFEVKSMLTVPLKTHDHARRHPDPQQGVLGGHQRRVHGGRPQAPEEVAEYSSALIHRMIDPKFQLGPDDTARFVSKLTDLPLVTKIEELEIDEKLVETTGDAIIRREGVFPYKSLAPGSVAVVMTNPLDYAKRESFTQATDLASTRSRSSRRRSSRR